MIRIIPFDTLKPEEILNRDIRAEGRRGGHRGRHHCRCACPGR